MSNPRPIALRTVSERTPRSFPRPQGPEGRPAPIRAVYATHAFDVEAMRNHLPGDVIRRFQRAVRHGERLDRTLADRIAQAALEWAVERGATHFCHWFQPMTGATAEKHDSFIAFDDGRPLSRFTGGMLIQSEPDANSFPSGGMRSTFEARGYTAWDPSSPMFLIDRPTGATLCIPSVFVSYHGHALDLKTPLLRSMEAVQVQAVRLCHLLGDLDVDRVVATAGPEQEYFLVDRAWASLRPDLLICGRSLLGAAAPKGQTLEDHYFGSIPARVQAFMHELELELYRLGVPAKTRHNEVAPSQFEIAVLYEEANVAADHNQLVMELLKRVAERHDFAALLHEKPFAGVNGSGKHLNWSLADSLGRNLLEPGSNPHQNLRFLAFLSAVLLGLHRHGAVLRATIATHGNDFRLGANEAPPAIISAFLGDQLDRICTAIARGEALGTSPDTAMIALGVGHLPELAKDSTDRNRTSPFAFTGNKFEFRAVGSNMSVSWPLAAVNTVVADGIRELCTRIEAKGAGDAAVWAAVQDALVETAPIRFEGNNYSAEWVEEAARRGLPNLRKAPDALAVLESAATHALFTSHGVLAADELESRFHIAVERYITTAEIEGQVLCGMVDQHVLPALVAERTSLASDLAALRAAGIDATAADRAAFDRVHDALQRLRAARTAVDTAVEAAAAHGMERARAWAGPIADAVSQLRAASDTAEALVADHRWTLPTYREMLFQNG